MMSRVYGFIKSIYKIVRILIITERKLFVSNTVLIVLSGLLPIVTIYLNKSILDSVFSILVKPYRTEYVWKALFYVCLITIVLLTQKLMAASTGTIQFLLSSKLKRFMMESVFEKSYRTDLKYFENPEFYDRLSRAAAEAGYRPMIIVQTLVGLAQAVFVFVTLVFILFGISPLLVGVLLLSVLPSFFIEKRLRRLVFDTHQQKTPIQRKMSYINILFTGIGAVRELKIFRLGEYFKSVYGEEFRKSYRLDRRLALRRLGVSLLLALMEFVTTLYVYFFALMRVVSKKATIGDFSFIVQSFGKCQDQVQAIVNNIYSLYENNLFISNYFEFMEIESEIEGEVSPEMIKRSGKAESALISGSADAPDIHKTDSQDAEVAGKEHHFFAGSCLQIAAGTF